MRRNLDGLNNAGQAVGIQNFQSISENAHVASDWDAFFTVDSYNINWCEEIACVSSFLACQGASVTKKQETTTPLTSLQAGRLQNLCSLIKIIPVSGVLIIIP